MNRLAPLFLVFLIWGCSPKASLQEYFVSKAEDGNFLIVNIPTSTLGIPQDSLSVSDQAALSSFHKLNILVYKADLNNPDIMKQELNTIRSIIDAKPYEELMVLNDKRLSGKVIVVGQDNDLKEVVFFGQSPNLGFVLARVLGDQMTTKKVVQVASLVQEENVDSSIFTNLQSYF